MLGPFRVLSLLGRGGMAEVYLVEVAGDGAPLPSGSRAALKLLQADLVATPEIIARFEREARVGTALRHPRVVATLGAGRLPGPRGDRLYLLMEVAAGRTLRALLDAEARLPEAGVRMLAVDVAEALGAIHAAGFVHRDVKPENIFLSPEGRASLADHGLALIREESVRLTRTGQFLGSLYYAAPEQIRGARGADGRSDLYSLGVVLLECLTGRNPFAHADVRLVIRRHLEDVPPEAGASAPETSLLLEAIVARLLRKDPGERFEDAAQVLQMLDAGESSGWWREALSARRRASLEAAVSRVRRRDAGAGASAPAPPPPAGQAVSPRALGRILGQSERMETVRRKLLAFAAFPDRHVLFAGESGVGKSLCALALHELTRGEGTPMVVVDALGVDLAGALSRAAEGSILVEGIEELPPGDQGRIAALLDRGGAEGAPRVMVTTAWDPADPRLEERLRRDLYYRLRGLTLLLPPLRSRAEDVPVLADHFRRGFRAGSGGSVEAFAPGAMDLLRGHAWPGNVRQLRDAVEAAILEAGPLATIISPDAVRSVLP